jgi:hypothetical protein
MQITCVKAAISTIRRHRALGRSPALPLGVFLDQDGTTVTIRVKHMERAIRNGCILAASNYFKAIPSESSHVSRCSMPVFTSMILHIDYNEIPML